MKPGRSKIDVVFERIPPFISWVLITMPIWGGLLIPEITAGVVIFFNIYFLYKSFSITVFIIISALNLRKNESINWLTRLEEIDTPEEHLHSLENKLLLVENEVYSAEERNLSDNEYLNKIIKKRLPDFLKKAIFNRSKAKAVSFIKSEIKRIESLNVYKPYVNWHELQHIVIIPHWKEPYEVLKDTVERLKSSNYPTEKINIVMAAEARDEEGIKMSEKLKSIYGQYFGNFWVTSHVMQPGDLIGKSSNMSFASKEIYQKITDLNWDLEKVTITSCDADSQLPPDYFSNLTYYYIFEEDRKYKYYTGAVQLYANIWRLPFFARVKNSMSTIYNVGRLVRTDKLVPFSTYTTSFWMIKEIGFWSADIIPEDFHTFFKGLFAYPDKVATIPIYQKILSDAAEGEGVVDTIKNNYFQERRWSWGISDDGWILKNLLKGIVKGKANLRMAYISLHIIFDHISGVGLAFLVSLGGTIPLLINPRFANTILGFNLPIASEIIVRLTIFFLLIMIITDSFMKPEMGTKPSFFKRILLILEWIIQPVVGILMVTLPGFEAHTRLLFGKYLEYYLTKKK